MKWSIDVHGDVLFKWSGEINADPVSWELNHYMEMEISLLGVKETTRKSMNV